MENSYYPQPKQKEYKQISYRFQKISPSHSYLLMILIIIKISCTSSETGSASIIIPIIIRNRGSVICFLRAFFRSVSSADIFRSRISFCFLRSCFLCSFRRFLSVIDAGKFPVRYADTVRVRHPSCGTSFQMLLWHQNRRTCFPHR